MQGLYVLRGCALAYVFGLVVVMAIEIIQRAVMGSTPFVLMTEFLVLVAGVGLVLALIATGLVMIIWAELAARRVLVRWWVTPLIGAGFGLLVALLFWDEGAQARLTLVLFGSFSGMVTWLGAFGAASSMRLGWRMPAP